MYELEKKMESYWRVNLLSYEKRIYRAAVLQRLRKTDIENQLFLSDFKQTWTLSTDIPRILSWELIIKYPHYINLVPETAVLM